MPGWMRDVGTMSSSVSCSAPSAVERLDGTGLRALRRPLELPIAVGINARCRRRCVAADAAAETTAVTRCAEYARLTGRCGPVNKAQAPVEAGERGAAPWSS